MKKHLFNTVSKIFFIANTAKFYLSHRHTIGPAVVQKLGIEFVVVGSKFEKISWPQKETTLQNDLGFDRNHRTFISVVSLFLYGVKSAILFPRAVFHLVSIFPMIGIGLPLRVFQRKCVFTVSGFGSAFQDDYKFSFLKPFLLQLYKFLFNGKNSRVIVQNQDAQNTLLSLGIKKENIFLNRGSTVSQEKFPFSPKKISDVPKILVPARLYRDKGILEMVEASRILIARGFHHEVWFAGGFDAGNPNTMNENDIQQITKLHSQIKFLGHVENILSALEGCDIVCLPSHHEGLPRALIEACAVGRPVVAYDIPGVREIVENKKSGLLVPLKTTGELADAIMNISSQAEFFVQNAYQKFLKDHSEAILNEQTISAYRSLIVASD